MQSYSLKFTFKAPKKSEFPDVTITSSFKGSKEMSMEGNGVSYPLLLVSDIFLGLEKNESKEVGKPLQEGLISAC